MVFVGEDGDPPEGGIGEGFLIQVGAGVGDPGPLLGGGGRGGEVVGRKSIFQEEPELDQSLIFDGLDVVREHRIGDRRGGHCGPGVICSVGRRRGERAREGAW